jgi:hypothetical protein
VAIHTTEDMLSLSLHTDAWDFTGVSTDIIVDFLELVEDLHYWLAERLEGSTAENKGIMLAFSKDACRSLFLAVGQLNWPQRISVCILIGRRQLDHISQEHPNLDLLANGSASAPTMREPPIPSALTQGARERVDPHANSGASDRLEPNGSPYTQPTGREPQPTGREPQPTGREPQPTGREPQPYSGAEHNHTPTPLSHGRDAQPYSGTKQTMVKVPELNILSTIGPSDCMKTLIDYITSCDMQDKPFK